MPSNRKSVSHPKIPVNLTEDQFDEFVLSFIPKETLGRRHKITLFKVFNYILHVLYTGCQWKSIPIAQDSSGKPEIHFSNIFRAFKKWVHNGVLVKIFEYSVENLHKNNLIDARVIHGDGSTTMAKKGGDNLGFSGHKHMKSEKVVAFCDRRCHVLSPMITAPGNQHESPLFFKAMDSLKDLMNRIGVKMKDAVMSLDSAYDSKTNRKKIFNAGMIPNIKENKRNRKKAKVGKKRMFNDAIYQERFRTIERVFAWEDKFKRLLLRFERKSSHHFAMKLIAYTLINLRHFCS